MAGFFLITACSKTVEFPWQDDSYTDLVSRDENKIKIIYFYTEW